MSAARSPFHTSCSTFLAPRYSDITRPYMNPVWCAIGDAIITVSAPVSPSRSA